MTGGDPIPSGLAPELKKLLETPGGAIRGGPINLRAIVTERPMTESEWLASSDPAAMLWWATRRDLWAYAAPGEVPRNPFDRKLRLFACACCRLANEGEDINRRIFDKWEVEGSPTYSQAIDWANHWIPVGAASHLISQPTKAALLRDIFGNPWKRYIWSDHGNTSSDRDDHGSAASLRHAEIMDQGGAAGRVDVVGPQGLAGRGRSSSASGVYSASHRRGQHERRDDEPGDDNTGRSPSVSRGRSEREADGPGIRDDNRAMLQVPGEIPGQVSAGRRRVSEVQASEEKGSSQGTIRDNGCIVLDVSIRTPSVLSIAQAIYDERAFDRMPVLADALEEAGCREEAILRHCRGEEWVSGRIDGDYCDSTQKRWITLRGPHVRGCWVIDLILGKE